MAEETFTCFTTLLEKLPAWISELEQLSKTAVTRQNDLILQDEPVDNSRALPRRNESKSFSPESSATDEADNGQEAHTSKPGASGQTLLHPEQQRRLTTADALRLAQRKRKTISVCSEQRSGIAKCRSRGAVVLYYDGETQSRFEGLVRAIGVCRNSLRKGKMNAKVHALTRLTSNESDGSGGNEDEDMAGIKDSGCRVMGFSKRIVMKSRRDDTQSLDKLDEFLEKAQSLCERAAHQVLRDGDCGNEIGTAKQHFRDAKQLCEMELPAARNRAEQAAELRLREEEKRQARREREERERYERQASSSTTDNTSDEKATPPEDPFSTPRSLAVDLEVGSDSDDDGRDDFDFATFQMNKFRQMRRERLAAV